MKLREMQEKRNSLVKQADLIVRTASHEKRGIATHEDIRLEGIKNEIFDLDSKIASEMHQLSLDGERHMRSLRGDGRSLGMNLEGYSLTRAITQAGQGRLDGYELEVSQEIAQRSGKSPSGFFVPYALMAEKRAMSVTGAAGVNGGSFVATEVRGFIDALRPFLKIAQAGATILDGLTSNVAIPRQSAASTASWKAENAPLDEATPAIGQLELSPKRVGAFTQLSKQLLIQATPDVERIVRNDLMSACAVALDMAAITGTGADGQPTGILSTIGIGDVAGGVAGAAPTWANIVALIGKVADANAEFGNLGFLTNSKVASKLRSTPKVAATDSRMILDAQDLLGYLVSISNNVPSNLVKGASGAVCSGIIFGNFADVILASFGDGIDLIVDPFSRATEGLTRVIANSYVDVGIRRAESFAAMKDALTA